MRRSDQRRAAVFTLYQDEVMARPVAEAVEDAAPFSRDLVAGVEAHRDELDAEIGALAKGWKLDDGGVQDKTFRAGEKFRPVRTETRRMQYLYDSGEMAVFMDNSDYSQLEVGRDVVGDSMRWVVPNSEVEVLFVDERPAGVQVPSAVEMAVTETSPGLKGDTASGGGTKPATLESGVRVEVPLFVNEGDRVRVDTRSGEYVSRA